MRDMNIRYISSVENINGKDVSHLFKVVGWGERPSETVRPSFERISFTRFAYNDRELVGVGRTIDDGYYYGWIVDLAVLPQYQRKGIGTRILSSAYIWPRSKEQIRSFSENC